MAIADDLVFVSSGYGIGSKLFRIRAGEEGKYRSETVWESRGLRTKFTNTVLHKGSLYGLDEGILVCLDPETGRRRWKRGRYGHGQLILVGELLLITSEQGEVALVEANPERFQEVARFPAIEEIPGTRRPSAETFCWSGTTRKPPPTGFHWCNDGPRPKPAFLGGGRLPETIEGYPQRPKKEIHEGPLRTTKGH